MRRLRAQVDKVWRHGRLRLKTPDAARLDLVLRAVQTRPMDVTEAVRRAKQAAQEYAGEHVGVRVEEVEQVLGSDWNITLSWLEEDAAERVRVQSDPLRRLGLRSEAPALERVYRVFEVREATAVRMKRAPEP